MKLLIPPPLLTLISAIFMFIISKYFNQANFSLNQFNQFALFFLIVGMITLIISILKFIKIKTTISPLEPNKTSILVVSGIYKYTRNPMYLGLLLILFSLFLYLKNFLSFLALPLFVIYITKNQILPEEKILENLFNDQYKKYKNQVRRWI